VSDHRCKYAAGTSPRKRRVDGMTVGRGDVIPGRQPA